MQPVRVFNTKNVSFCMPSIEVSENLDLKEHMD